MNNDTSSATSAAAVSSSRNTLSASSQSWEFSKENIQPIRSGRNVAVIDQVMLMQSNNSDMLANEQQHFEDQIRTNTSDDPLDAWYRYYRWFEEHHPSGKETEMLSLVQKCLKSFSADKRYSNDRRLLKIWLKYAEGRQSTLSVYEFMYQNGNCTRLADFYIRWADRLESAEDYRKTTEIFKIAQQMQAKPTENLMEAQRMFEERMALREIQNQQEAHGQEEETRCFLGNLKGVGKKREAPVIRASTGFASGLGQNIKSRPEMQSNGNKVGFHVYEDRNQSEQLVQLKTKTSSVGSFPVAESGKENFRAPTVWSNSSLAGKRYSSATSIAPSFQVYTDDISLIDKQRRQTIAIDSNALQTKKDQQQFHPVHALTDQTSSKDEKYMFDKARLYAGTKEYSFEEMRALTFVPIPPVPKIRNCLPKSTTIVLPPPLISPPAIVSEPIEIISQSNIRMPLPPPIAPTRRGLQIRMEPVLPIVSNPPPSNIPQPTFAVPSIPQSNTANNNTSMTRNIYKETMAVFSNTLQLQTDAVVDDIEKMDDEDESICPPQRVQPFQVYCDIPETKQSIVSSSIDYNDPDKENNRPPDYVIPPKREKSGILLSSKDFDIESDILDTTDEKISKLDSTFVKPIVPESKKAVSKSIYSDETTTMFDTNEPTLARYSTLSATNRAASTPCDGKMVRPCFSARRWDEVDQVLDEFKPLAENLPRPDDIIIQIPNIIDIEPLANDPTNGDRRLSIIQETSREYRSGSSGCNSTNGFLKNTPRAATPSMPPIVESNSSEMERDKLDGAVRRLSLGGDEPTGVGMRIGIIGDTNPWDLQIQERILAHAKISPNYHHFANSRMPVIKANSAVAIGGERLKIDALIGQGAFAKIYRCYADEGDLWVIKMQKPACPWEFYICEELRRRLSSELMVGVMSIRDAFIYDDGSLLINEYYPLGTLLDIRNKFRLAGSDMHEFVVIYLFIQILKIVEAVHSAEIIHADIKPDNFLITSCIEVTSNWEELIGGSSPRTIKLIDWGRGIDMKQMRGRTFKGKVGTSGFECCEMQDGRPWTYQTDLYGLLGSVHVLLYGNYMNVFNERNRYRTTSVIKRRWKREQWIPLFVDLLNIADCSNIPSLTAIRHRFEQTFKSILQLDKHSWLVSARQFNDHLTK